MDFKRIEWIFLIVFIGINIFLGVEIFQTPTLLSPTTSSGATADLNTEIKADNIKLPKLSTEQKDGYYLAAKTDNTWNKEASAELDSSLASSFEDNTLSVSLTDPVKVSHNKKEKLAKIKRFVNNAKNVYQGKKYQYVAELSNGSEYTFDQESNYGLTYSEGARLRIQVKNDQIVSYTQTYIQNLSPVRERQTTLSAKGAIDALYTYSELPNNSKVLWAKFGYSKLIDVRGSIVYIPVWTVAIESNNTKVVTIKQVNAFTGKLVQDNSNETDNKDVA
ncbi:two-component system regulatory protein YycI [Lactobacillus sp. PV034]|uniref:two-component system regulatory protein YycI n=1 Tax=Lactobacillus sp. PV034 TaxID=2594495 RepID=UPI0022404AF0|nr:two-component system regulatory protein YycI [Lactobacillus sp. PV034]QNQ81078.1 hypothetical protein FP432_05655 [Lactobacillus sp. PV034]